MSDKATLYVNGRIYDGWKEVEIRNSLKSVSGSFSLSITDKWSGQSQPWAIAKGDECELKLGNDTVITGWVDTVSPEADIDNRSIAVAGRDKTCDLVDCSAIHSSGEIAGVTLKRLAEILCAPFSVPVIFEGNPGARFEVVKINQGDSPFEILEKQARKRGFLLTTNSKGALVITRPGKVLSSTRLEFGKNVKRGSATFDGKNQFSSYTVKSQDSGYSQELDPSFAYSIKASAKDPSVKRYRPLLIQAEQLAGLGDAQTRANWEATVRAARGDSFNVTVQGWRQGDGTLWRPNQLVQCKAEWIGLNGEMLITDVVYKLDDSSGTTVVLNLERKDAYTPEPSVPEKGDPLTQAIRKDPGIKRSPI